MPKPVTWNGTDAQGQPLRWDSGLKWNGTVPDPPPDPSPPPKKMNTRILHVALAFADGPDHAVEETATAVMDKLYGNTHYPTPPVTSVDLEAARDAFTSAVGAATNGGKEDTAHRDNTRADLVALLRVLAAFVEQKHGNDMEVLLGSGFDAISTNRASRPLDKPAIKKIKNGISTQLIVVGVSPKNSRALRLRYALLSETGTPGPWIDAGLFTDSRNMAVSPLIPGRSYIFQLCAIGGSTGCSDWSDPSSHMSL